MSNAIIPADKAKAVLANFRRQHSPVRLTRMPILMSETSGLASTYIFARTDGGVGVSTLVRMCCYFLPEQPFIIQVGGSKSWAYKDLGNNDFSHIRPYEDCDRFSPPLDKRMEQPGRVAIIEYEQGMTREAIKAVNFLSRQYASHAVLCLVASAEVEEFGTAKIAREQDVERLLLFREHDQGPETSGDFLQIPTVPRVIAKQMRANPGSFNEYADAWLGPVSGMMFFESLDAFELRIVEQLA